MFDIWIFGRGWAGYIYLDRHDALEIQQHLEYERGIACCIG